MRKLITLFVLLAVYTGMLAPARLNAQIIAKTMQQRLKDMPPGLTFRLSEGRPADAAAVARPQPSSAEKLSDADASRLLGRLVPITPQPDDKTEFAKRLGTLPPPKTGKRVSVKFPADEQRGTPKVDPGRALEVIRYSPAGEVELAPDLSVTFSQPMVAVTSQEHASQYAPVELTPQVEGRWRWLGTKTLMFDAAKRFPMATKFTARVPAGTRAANGQVLEKDFIWTFTTPPPKVEQMYPHDQIVRRDEIIFLSFDQAIDPQAVLRTISVSSAGRRLQTRLATEAEIAASAPVSNMSKAAQPGRWIALRAVGADGSTANALPSASTIAVTVEKGTPSAEGPLTTVAARSFAFQTYGPMKFVRGYCGYRSNKKCTPFDQWYLEFNNPVDAASFDKALVKVEPPVEGLDIYPSGNYVYLHGYKKGNRTYKVTVDGGLKDAFGQQLGQAASATIAVGPADQALYSQGGQMVVLDPSARRSYSIYTINHAAVRVQIYQVGPENWHQFHQYVRRMNYDDDTQRPQIPGRLIDNKVVTIKQIADELTETRIDLTPYLGAGGYGHLIVDVQPTVKIDRYDRSRVFTWLQSTDIGLDAFVDNEQLVGFATELKTGRPLSGVKLSIFPNGAPPRPASTPGSASWSLSGVWNWAAGSIWGSSGAATETEAVDGDGTDAEIYEVPAAQTDTTGADGILRLPLPDSSAKGQNLLIARRGGDVAFLPENSEYYWDESGDWYRRPAVDSLRWFVFDDRGMYRPKEEVAVKGYIRKITGGKFGDVAELGSQQTYDWSARDPRNNEIAKGTITTNAFGAFDLRFALPDNTNLGYARIEFTTPGSSTPSFSHTFQIQEFRRPEFEVTAKVETDGPHLVGGSAMLSVEAKYYSGGGLANADTNWTVSATPTNYTPPNRGDFTFGKWVPWWGNYYLGDFDGRYGGGVTQTYKGVTDASGRHLLKIDFDSANPPRPYTVSASASVQDVNRQTWAGRTSLLVHPSTLYVGIRTPRTFVQKGEAINVESIVSDIDGKLVAGRDVEITATLKDWQFEKGSWREVTVDEQTCSIKSADSPQNCSFVAKQGGRYTIGATVMDDRERLNQSELTVWVPGGKTPPSRNVEQETVQIIPSKKEYAPGDMAELLVIASFTPAEGVLTLRREGIVRTERFTMKDSSITLRIPIDEKYLPNIFAQVDLVGAAPRQNDKGEIDPKLASRPAYASGNINLSVSIDSRRLSVTAEPRDKTLVPGGETKVDVEVKDNRGEPVTDSEVAVVIVDESVLALSRYSVADPMGIFYSARSAGVTDHHSRADLLLGNPEDAKAQAPPPPPPPPSPAGGAINARQVSELPMKGRAVSELRADGASAAENAFVVDGQEVSGGPDTPIKQRLRFDALAVFVPSARTDANGRVTVDVKLPDSLTRYRITAVAVDSGRRFGKTESNITARQPLMVRPSAPRFMNFGDRIELPVVIQNQTDNDMTVDVAVRAMNAELAGGNPSGSEGVTATGKRVLVKANDRAEVRFPAAAMNAGTARFQIAATSGKFADAAEISLPVWTPATTEAFATYGTTDQNGAIIQPVQTPGDVFPQFGGLEVTTSSTQLQELTDAFISLYRYPFECTEQVSSRMISIAALRDVLAAFKAKDMPSEAAIKASFEKDIRILQSRQREDGSFGLWRRDRERYEYPFVSVHAAHALVLAKAKGYAVPDEMLKRSRSFLRDVEKHLQNDEWYKNSPQVRWTISAYALYVRDLAGDKDVSKVKKLLAEATGGNPSGSEGVSSANFGKMPFEALGWILSVLAKDAGSKPEVDSIVRFLMNRTTETATTANFVTDYGDAAWLIMYSNRRADGVLLESLIKADPKNDLIPKLVRGLLDHRVKGAWSNTQENVFILLALDRYFGAFEKVTPEFVTRIWLGSAYAGEQQFNGRSIDSKVIDIPMSYLVEQGGTSNLLIDRQGAGRLYYRIGMKYAPRNLKLEPADHGFTVLRSYEAVDNADDVKQNADGSWTIRSGARVRVRLTMVAPARRYHVALVDNLPAGLEILNPELAVTEAIPGDDKPITLVTTYGSRSMGRGWWRTRYWMEHQNFRDERAEAFASLLWEGVYNYSYVARATTPGRFVVPPAKAEEMYHPETFGRTGTDSVSVE
ncbi:MAG: alpha-2-macroglobulin family protein [Pyrinomonadaceae bacterium]